MMENVQRVEQETMSSQNLANTIENMGKTRIDATGRRLRIKDGERLYPQSWLGSTPLGGFAREVAAWLGYVDPKHEAGKLIQRITKETLRATGAWTDGRHAEDDKCAELDNEVAVGLANATEGAARSMVLKVTQVEPSDGFVAWQALVDGYAPKSSNDPAIALQPILATTKKMLGSRGIERKAHSSTNGPGKRWYARREDDTERFGHEQRHVIRRRACDRVERVQSRQWNRQEWTERTRSLASCKKQKRRRRQERRQEGLQGQQT